MSSPLPVEIFDTLHELQHLIRMRIRLSMESAHPELTFNEMRVLMHTGRRPGLTQRELVEHAHADKAQMARLLATLEKRGLLTRTPDRRDRRLRCLQLSAAGQQLFAGLLKLQEEAVASLLDACPPATQAALLGLLRQARDSACARTATAESAR